MKVYLVMVTNEDWYHEAFYVYEVCKTLEKAKEIINEIKLKYDYDNEEVYIDEWKVKE